MKAATILMSTKNEVLETAGSTYHFGGLISETEKAIKVELLEVSKCADVFNQRICWIPKSVSQIVEDTLKVADWFFVKNIAFKS